MVEKVNEESVWDLLGRVREALHEFLPEQALSAEATTLDAEADELVRGIQLLGNLPPRSDLTALNKKFAARS